MNGAMNRDPRGIHPSFTLIELLVVVAIIAILASILLPSLARARDMAKRTACTNQVKQIALGLQIYSGDMEGYLPIAQYSRPMNFNRPATWVNDYLGDPAGLLRCPSHRTIAKASAAYDPWWMNTSQGTSSYQLATVGDYPLPLTGGYWFGWQSSSWTSGPGNLNAMCPNLNFADAYVRTTGGGTKVMYVGPADQQPIIAEGHRPFMETWVNGTSATYLIQHTGGMNVAMADGHVEFRRDADIQQRHRSFYW